MPRYQALHVDIQLVPQSQNSFIVLLNSEMGEEISWSKLVHLSSIAKKFHKKRPLDVKCFKACSLIEKKIPNLKMNLSITFRLIMSIPMNTQLELQTNSSNLLRSIGSTANHFFFTVAKRKEQAKTFFFS